MFDHCRSFCQIVVSFRLVIRLINIEQPSCSAYAYSVYYLEWKQQLSLTFRRIAVAKLILILHDNYFSLVFNDSCSSYDWPITYC